ncbi:MAG: hypothetical protein ACREAQ_06220 [Nitrososphaera sp.]
MPSQLEICELDYFPKWPRLFLICDFCLWAASAICTRRRDVVACPLCSNNISMIPLEDNERFTFQHDGKRGVELAFSSPR